MSAIPRPSTTNPPFSIITTSMTWLKKGFWGVNDACSGRAAAVSVASAWQSYGTYHNKVYIGVI